MNASWDLEDAVGALLQALHTGEDLKERLRGTLIQAWAAGWCEGACAGADLVMDELRTGLPGGRNAPNKLGGLD